MKNNTKNTNITKNSKKITSSNILKGIFSACLLRSNTSNTSNRSKRDNKNIINALNTIDVLDVLDNNFNLADETNTFNSLNLKKFSANGANGASGAKKQSIVICDDSEGMVQLIEEFLNELGFTDELYNIFTYSGMCCAFKTIEGLSQLEKVGLKHIDFAIIDLVLPGGIDINDKFINLDGIDLNFYLNYKFNVRNSCIIHIKGLNKIMDFSIYFENKIKKFKTMMNLDLNDNILYKEIDDEDFKNNLNLLLNKKKFIQEKVQFKELEELEELKEFKNIKYFL